SARAAFRSSWATWRRASRRSAPASRTRTTRRRTRSRGRRKPRHAAEAAAHSAPPHRVPRRGGNCIRPRLRALYGPHPVSRPFSLQTGMTQSAEKILIERNGSVTTIIINRPERRNALDLEATRQLVAAFRAFEADPEAEVAVLTGAGGSFCA